MRLIDADKLLRDIDHYHLSDGMFQHWVEVQQTIEPERMKGKWISDRLITTNGGTYGVRRCSECEASYQGVGYGWNFCPNCGARMTEEDV